MFMNSVIFFACFIQITSSFNLFGYDVDLEKFKITKEQQCTTTLFYDDITVTCRFVDVKKFSVFNFTIYEEDHVLHTYSKSQQVQAFLINQVGERNVTFRVCFYLHDENPPNYEYYYQFYHNCSESGIIYRSSSDDYEHNCLVESVVYQNHSITVPRGLEPRPSKTSYEDEWW